LIGLLLIAGFFFPRPARAAGAAPAAPAPVIANWPPPPFVADPHQSVRENTAGLFNYLADQASAHPELLLLAHHFRSMALIVSSDGASTPAVVDQIYDDYTSNWQTGPVNWSSYLNGRPLIFAWKRPYDGNVGVEYVMLPKSYDPNVAYPLYFELHAVSPGDSPAQVMYFASVTTPRGNAGIRRDGFHVYPWAGGLTEYHGVAIVDVNQALQQVDKYLNTDPARQYLYGFSMGGGGTWNYGALTVKKRGWAALGIYSGTTNPHPWEAEQLKHTPIWINCGEKDPWRVCNENMNNALIAAGNPPKFFEVDLGVGHSYRQDYQNRLLDWLASNVNPHPVLAPSAPATVCGFGDDALEQVFINGEPIEVGGGGLGVARVHEGENTIAVKVRNRIWTGGLVFTLALPDGQCIPSDGSWKVQYFKPADNWSAPGFDDSAWPAAGVLTSAPKPDVAKPTTRPIDLAQNAGAAFIGIPTTLYYRAEFTSAGGDASMKIRGVSTHFHVWLNGNSIGEGDFKSGMGKGPLLKGFQTVAGANSLAMEITTIGGTAQEAEVKAGLFYKDADGDLARLGTGAGWHVSAEAPEGWTAAAFDDSKWPITDDTFINAVYDGGADGTGDGTFTAQVMAPGDMYFRKTFKIDHLTVPTPAPVPATQPAQ
jgi:predicted esterase